MNLPNKLSLFRMALVPFFVIAFLYEPTAARYELWLSLAIFALAAITDKLDGTIARKYGLITNFGKFIDPLADKLLTLSAFVCLAVQGVANVYLVLIILARELAITGFRTIAMESGVALAADGLGKIKTFFQFVSIIVLIGGELPIAAPFVGQWGQILFFMAAILTVVSGVNYVAKNWACMGKDL